MNGMITLIGSGEYLPAMNEVDRYLLDSMKIGGRKPRVVCLPTAAGQEGDKSVNYWSSMGVAHFQELGAEVSALSIIDRESADDSQWEPLLDNADMIYFSGGDPGYLYETMNGSRAWDAARRAWERGAIYAGCSAGAMILANRIPRFRVTGSGKGFGIVPAKFIVPHFDAIPVMFRPLAFALRKQLDDGQRMIGIDEDTALIGTLGGEWRVMGQSKVHVFTNKGVKKYENGQTLFLD
jgi:cyanophycinase